MINILNIDYFYYNNNQAWKWYTILKKEREYIINFNEIYLPSFKYYNQYFNLNIVRISYIFFNTLKFPNRPQSQSKYYSSIGNENCEQFQGVHRSWLIPHFFLFFFFFSPLPFQHVKSQKISHAGFTTLRAAELVQ